MERLLQVLKPKGQHRRPRTDREVPASTTPASWLVADADPAEVNDLAIDMLLGYDPRDRFL